MSETSPDTAAKDLSHADTASTKPDDAQRQHSGHRPGQRADDKTVDLPDAFASMVAKDRLHPDSVSQLQEDYSAQSTDGWSAATQQAISDYLGRTAPQKGFDIVAVGCHQSLCEIQATTYEGHDRGLAWTDVMNGMYRQSPPLSIAAERWKLDDQGGRIYILAFIGRPGRP